MQSMAEQTMSEHTVAEHAIAETDQAKRIRKAVEEASKRRDRYAEDRVEDLLKTLDAAADDVAKQVATFEKKAALKPWQEFRLSVLKDLEGEIEEISKEVTKNWKVGLSGNVEGAMELGIEDGIRQLEAMEHPDFAGISDKARRARIVKTFATIDKAAVDFLANYQLNLLGEVSTELAAGIKRTITQGVLTGKIIPDVARDIGRVVKDKDAFKKAGKTVFKTAQRRATLIARTETLRAHNEGRKVFYREVGIAKVKWMTAHDDRLCNECASLDGKVFKMDEVPGPPKHPNCRCTVIAVIKT